MNKDQVKGSVKDVAGKVQEKAGKVTGNTKQELKGIGKQIAGKVQKGVGDMKDAVKKASAKNDLQELPGIIDVDIGCSRFSVE